MDSRRSYPLHYKLISHTAFNSSKLARSINHDIRSKAELFQGSNKCPFAPLVNFLVNAQVFLHHSGDTSPNGLPKKHMHNSHYSHNIKYQTLPKYISNIVS